MRREARAASVVAVVALAGACSGASADEAFLSLGRDSSDGGSGGSAGYGGKSVDAGPACGNGGMAFTPEADPDAAAIQDACERAGANQRICFGNDSVWYCGENVSGLIEQCGLGTCANGCCHEVFDPCPVEPSRVSDCAGDCGVAFCVEAPLLNLTLSEDDLHVVRVGGSNTVELMCDAGTRRYFELLLDGPSARVTVSPPWRLSEGISCDDAGFGQCVVSPSGLRFVVVSTDSDGPPPRNVIIETSTRGPTCQ